MDYDPISILENVGYTEREAAFIYLVARHSGYFLRRQYCRFIERERGGLATKFLRKAEYAGHIKAIECGQARRIYHLTSRPVYEVLGLEDSQLRRLKGDAQIQCRLMVLDFVLDHRQENLLDAEETKRAFFTEMLRIEVARLTQSHSGSGQFFPDSFPILIAQEQSSAPYPQFTFFDEGELTTKSFERYLRQYAPLFLALERFELLLLATSDRNFQRATRIFAKKFPQRMVLGMTEQTPLGVDHFLEFLHARELHENKSRTFSARDLEVLREGEHIYGSLEHQALYAAWKIRSTNEERIRHRFQQRGPKTSVRTVILPYRYPLSTMKRERATDRSTGASDGAA
ncbi:MAG: hypothetical protein ACYDBH_11600 [Acidobacteriaceae bacterium]